MYRHKPPLPSVYIGYTRGTVGIANWYLYREDRDLCNPRMRRHPNTNLDVACILRLRYFWVNVYDVCYDVADMYKYW